MNRFVNRWHINQKQIEQTYISKLVLEGVDKIVERWREILGQSVKIDVASVFATKGHILLLLIIQKNHVKLQMYFFHCNNNIFGFKIYKKILLQAKKDDGNKEIKLNIDPQLELYTKFPRFRYGQTNTK
ncbi:hypothetical protein [Bacillus toyonensis]